MNEQAEDLKKVRPLDEQAEFVMSFVEDSDDARSVMEPTWDEVDDNFLVRPAQEGSHSRNTAIPLDPMLSGVMSPRHRNSAILKDPETHQDVMTLLATIVLQTFPTEDSFVATQAVGFEDILGSMSMNKLTEHAMRLPGHFWAKMSWVLQALLRGTGINRWGWEYSEEVRSKRQVGPNPFTGEMESRSVELMVPVWDDPRCRITDTRDFYPDHGVELLQDMNGAAEHYRMVAAEATRRAARGIFDEKSIDDAISRKDEDVRAARAKRSDSVDDVSPERRSMSDFMELDAYEYIGETPFRGRGDDTASEDGIVRRVITVMNGATVRSRPWPRRLPWTECKIIPRMGSFWGMSVGELVRHDQDFADTIKMMLADAVVRMTHPPMIYNKNMEVDLQKLRRFNPRVPIGANSTEAVRMFDYAPRLGDAFAMYGGVKGQMRDASTALDSLQGQPGPSRESATSASLRFQAAGGRPELFSTVLEREFLPNDGRIVMELYQEFIEDDSDLAKRIGESEIPVTLANILGDFDVKFIGSRHTQNRVQQIENFREINAAAASNPVGASTVPWIMVYRKWFKDMGAEDIAAQVGNQELMAEYIERSQVLGSSGPSNGNGAPTTAAPSGLLPAQTGGITG